MKSKLRLLSKAIRKEELCKIGNNILLVYSVILALGSDSGESQMRCQPLHIYSSFKQAAHYLIQSTM